MRSLSSKILRGTARAEREASVGSITTKILSGTISKERGLKIRPWPNLLIKKLHKKKKMDKKVNQPPKRDVTGVLGDYEESAPNVIRINSNYFKLEMFLYEQYSLHRAISLHSTTNLSEPCWFENVKIR